MKLRDYSRIALFHDHNQENVRLLELPPELYDLVTAGSDERLWLKSTPTQSSSDANSTSAQAVLCTRSTTYQLRQVQTSNTVLVVQPVQVLDEAGGTPQSSLTAFATCTNTLELQIQTSTQPSVLKSAVEWLNENLLVYETPDSHDDKVTSDPKGKDALFNDIPYSPVECEIAWDREAAFEWQGSCWRIAPEKLLETWIRFITSATAQGIDLTVRFPRSTVVEVLDELDLPLNFGSSFCRRLQRSTDDHPPEDGMVNPDKKLMIGWVGEILVSARTTNEKQDGVWQVLEKWQNLLPEKWRAEVTTKEVLALRHKIRGIAPCHGEVEELEQHNNGVKRPATTTIKRNWHEKFKRSRA